MSRKITIELTPLEARALAFMCGESIEGICQNERDARFISALERAERKAAAASAKADRFLSKDN